MTETNVGELSYQFSDRFVGQPEWVVHAWGVLAAAGVVPLDVDDMHPNLTDHLVTLAALAYLAEVINNADGAQVPDITEGVFPVADIDLGRYAERQGVYSDEWPENATDLAAECVKRRMPAVARALAGELTPTTLFLDLWAQREGVVDYPLDDETTFSICNDNLSGDKMVAHDWLMGEVLRIYETHD